MEAWFNLIGTGGWTLVVVSIVLATIGSAITCPDDCPGPAWWFFWMFGTGVAVVFGPIVMALVVCFAIWQMSEFVCECIVRRNEKPKLDAARERIADRAVQRRVEQDQFALEAEQEVERILRESR